MGTGKIIWNSGHQVAQTDRCPPNKERVGEQGLERGTRGQSNSKAVNVKVVSGAGQDKIWEVSKLAKSVQVIVKLNLVIL